MVGGGNKCDSKSVFIDCALFNAQSLGKKFHCLLSDPYLNMPAGCKKIVAITESWLNSDSYIPPEISNHYNLFRKDRNDNIHKTGGGVVLMVHKNIPSFAIDCSFSTKLFDFVIVKVQFRHQNLFICLVYRPPGQCSVVADELRQLIECVSSLGSCILLGDFNYRDVCWNDYINVGPHTATDTFLNAVISNDLTNHVLGCTHKSGSILDLVLTNEVNLVQNVHIGEPFSTSDHFKISFQIAGEPPLERTTRPRRNFYKANYIGLADYLGNISWPDEFNLCKDIDEFWTHFSSLVNKGVDMFVPFFRQSNRKCFISKQTHKLYCKKRKYKRKFARLIKNGSSARTDELRLKISVASKSARESSINDIAAKEQRVLQSGNVKQFWAYVNSKLSSKPGVPVLKLHNGHTATSDVEKASALNEQFASVFRVDNGIQPFFIQPK